MPEQFPPLTFEYSAHAQDNIDPNPAMMDEIAQILKKHQALNRFGITRIEATHNPDSVKSESCWPEQRWLIMTDEAAHKVDDAISLETQWRLDVPGMLKACKSICTPDGNAHGVLTHKGDEQQVQ